MSKLLLIVDPQIDFINGSLPVPGAAAAIDSLANHIKSHGKEYHIIAVTLDWHPFSHASFTDNGGQWPLHCVAYSVGASVWPTLMDVLSLHPRKVIFLTKGIKDAPEEYSVFANINSTDRLISAIRESDINNIDLCGLAGDICVAATLSDGVRLLPDCQWQVLESFSPSLDGGKHLKQLTTKLNVPCVRL